MAGGGWEWQADRERWVAHAPVERGATALVLVAFVGQLVMWLTGPNHVLAGPRWWLVLPWAAVWVPVAVGAGLRLRRPDVTFDGEVVEITGLLGRTRFRPADVVALRPGPPVARPLLRVRVRRRERTLAGLPVPALRRTSAVAPQVPDWWWHQIVGLPPELLGPGPLARAWSRLRRRPSDRHPAPAA